MIKPIRLLLLAATLVGCAPALAEEAILDYFSDIQVHADGSMTVRETIKVRAEGAQIKRGIYRDFPTDYQDRLGNNYRVGFDLLAVERDDRPEPCHQEKIGNGIRTYIGDKDVMLSPGVHTYVISYRTERQLGFFKDHDELYWNVTGNGWAFPIEQAGARVTLPDGVPADQIRAEGYTGDKGSRERNYRAQVDRNGETRFRTRMPLRPHQGLTIVVSWPKGYVREPSFNRKFQWFISDNREALVGGLGILGLLAYYLVSWAKVGRDPEAGVIIPLYEPPEGFSPAAVRYINRMGYDDKAMSAALVNMAVQGYLTIDEDKKGTFELARGEESPTMFPGEQALGNALFSSGRDRLKMEQKNHATFSNAIGKLKDSLANDYEKRYFLTNRLYIIPGVLISIAVALLIVMTLQGGEEKRYVAGFMTLWLSVWTGGVIFLLKRFKRALSNVFRNGSGIAAALGAGLFAFPFLVGELAGLFVLGWLGSLTLLLVLVAMLTINYLFYEWMKAPTLLGRRLLDRVEGFKLYLEVAEKDELELKNPPEKTPELFERYLPYAIALDVEHRWGEKFTTVLEQARADGQAYQPSWYQGSSWGHRNFGSFASAMGGSMSSAISASSTAPGSSSGSSSGGGGGGSSGGGGGGGGGGGW